MDYAQQEINLMKLYTEGTTTKWNDFLTDCFLKRDINRLVLTRVGIQKGMATLEKQKLNTPKLNEWFIRLNRSLELTARKIINELNPMPTDNPFNKEFKTKQWVEAKRKRDQAFENFLRKKSY